MVVQDFAAAHIHLILASDDERQVRELTRDLKASRYRYILTHSSRKDGLPNAVAGTLAHNGGRLPTVLVINYKFAPRDCAALLRLAHAAGKKGAIQCIVTDPPADPDIQRKLTQMGARLFLADDATLLSEMTFH